MRENVKTCIPRGHTFGSHYLGVAPVLDLLSWFLSASLHAGMNSGVFRTANIEMHMFYGNVHCDAIDLFKEICPYDVMPKEWMQQSLARHVTEKCMVGDLIKKVTVNENVCVLAGEPLRSGRPPRGQSALHAGVGRVEASAILSSDS